MLISLLEGAFSLEKYNSYMANCQTQELSAVQNVV